MREIYLDNHSATRPSEELLDQMRSMLSTYWASSTSPYAEGQIGYLPLVASLRKLYELMGACDADHFYFSSSAAEAVDQVFLSTYISHAKQTGRTHFYAAGVEEAPIMLAAQKMEKMGCTAKTLAVNSFGQITKQILEENLRPRAAMLSISWASGLTGVIHPLHDIIEICKQKDVLLHVDASSMIGKSFFRFEDLQVDFMTFDASVFHGPRGCAGSFVKAFSPFCPHIAKQPSEPIAQICTLAEAMELAAEQFDRVCTETARLRDRLEANISAALPNVFMPFKEAERLPTTSVICFPGVVNEALLYHISSKGVLATMGGGSFQKLSHILELCGVDRLLSLGSLSFTLSYQTTQQEIDEASEIIISAYKSLQAMGGYLSQGGV